MRTRHWSHGISGKICSTFSFIWKTQRITIMFEEIVLWDNSEWLYVCIIVAAPNLSRYFKQTRSDILSHLMPKLKYANRKKKQIYQALPKRENPFKIFSSSQLTAPTTKQTNNCHGTSFEMAKSLSASIMSPRNAINFHYFAFAAGGAFAPAFLLPWHYCIHDFSGCSGGLTPPFNEKQMDFDGDDFLESLALSRCGFAVAF